MNRRTTPATARRDRALRLRRQLVTGVAIGGAGAVGAIALALAAHPADASTASAGTSSGAAASAPSGSDESPSAATSSDSSSQGDALGTSQTVTPVFGGRRAQVVTGGSGG